MNASDARSIILEFLREDQPGLDLVIVNVIERPIGWGFMVQGREFAETGDFELALFGVGPFLVTRASGEVVELMTFQSLEDEMKDYANSVRPRP